MDKVRFGVVGLGNMGSHHISYLNSIDGAVLTAVCDPALPSPKTSTSSAKNPSLSPSRMPAAPMKPTPKPRI